MYIKTAKQLFEDLGYEIHFDGLKYLMYVSFNKDTRQDYKSIQFNKLSKSIELCVSKNHTFKLDVELNMAIQKQIEELKWNYEE